VEVCQRDVWASESVKGSRQNAFLGHQKGHKIAGGNASESVKGSRQNAFFPVSECCCAAATRIHKSFLALAIFRRRHEVLKKCLQT